MQIIKLQKRGEIMKKIIKCMVVIFLLMLFVTTSEASQVVSWYCVREKNHIQPKLKDDLKVVEEYDVYWVDKRYDENSEEKVIYLTFDAGYENGNIEKILDTLKDENVKAGFFVLENLLIKNKDLVQRMINEGHTIANHTSKHRDMSKISSKNEFESELKSLEDIFKNEYGFEMPKFYRPPEGKFSLDNLKWAKELGYKTVMWSFAYADWDNGRQMSAEKAKVKILDNIHNGEVMLLHPTSSTNAEILKDVIQSLKTQGFKFGTLEELCNK